MKYIINHIGGDSMKGKRRILDRIISLILVITILLMSVGCSSSPPPTPTISDANPQTITENIEIENTITEKELHEFITSEIYLEELVLAEDKITELLLDEESIAEVLCCKTIYVPQEHIEDFAENSQTTHLFGEGINIKSVLTKIVVGTGAIVTVVVVKKAHLPKPIASAVIAAADKSLKFAGTGAALGSLYGGLTGATDELDETGRTSAVIGFAIATVGLIITAVSFVTAIPSGGITAATAGEGISLIIAGVELISAASATAYSGYNAVKTFTSTEATDIDWDNVDWEKVGVSSAEKAIENSADGYMWGAIVGAVHGGAEGYEYYHKYNTPYTNYEARIKQLKKMKKGIGKWTGVIGESEYVLNDPIILPDGTKIAKVTYKNGVPDFSPYKIAEVKISRMTDNRDKAGGNYEQADEALAKQWNASKRNNKTNWTGSDVKKYRENYPVKLTWHEMNNMESMQLVPFDVNNTFKHYGGVAEYKAMIGQKEVSDFD